MPQLSSDQERLAISRLIHRFGYGPKPGEFSAAIKNGFERTKVDFLKLPTQVEIDNENKKFLVDDLGPRPTPGTFANTEHSLKMRSQIKDMTLWWLDQMVTSNYQLNEKMTWFWHGHWATSIEKINFALPMHKQNLTLRRYALGNFTELSKAMYNDGALQFWLDGQENTAKAPNENLSREFMELFTLGVGRYSEEDVKSLARIFTGIQVQRFNGNVTFNSRRHDSSAVNLLGINKKFTPEDAIELITSRDDASRFIYERMWFRFISSTENYSVDTPRSAFESRDIFQLTKELLNSPSIYAPQYAMVKSPVEWFVGLCRAFSVIPSEIKNSQSLISGLQRMAQLPFAPPNVGGWPAGESWLTSASAQFRLSLSQTLLKSLDYKELKATSPARRLTYLQNLLGVYQWSPRTIDALTFAKNEPERMILLAVNSPEYVVGA